MAYGAQESAAHAFDLALTYLPYTRMGVSGLQLNDTIEGGKKKKPKKKKTKKKKPKKKKP